MLDLSGLNPSQREAVLHGAGPLVVFAGAGSGKTRVITHRIAHLVGDRGVDPASILAVTFTNKAASEMRERLYPLLGPAARKLVVGTFHSTSARILREEADRFGLRKDFVIYDDQDQQAMLKRIVRDLDLDDRESPPRTLAQRIDGAKNKMLTPDEVPGRDALSTTVRTVYATYEQRMRAANALDFGDLIVRFARGLEADAELRTSLSRRFQYVLVDEFQDTNHAQLRLVLALVSTHRNLCVVGDDDQSIYRWRGAERKNILEFREHFRDARVVKLEQNYRSSKRILGVAYEVIRRAGEREDKRLFTENPDGDAVLVVRTATERDEAEMVVRGVKQLVSEGTALSSIAVFYRTHAQSRVLEEHLRAHAITYRIVGGQRFFERAEVKDLLAYLRLLTNPEDDVSCLRVLNVPARGIGKTTVDKVTADASRRGSSVFETLRALATSGELGKAATVKVAGFIALLERLTRDATSGTDLSVLARDVLELTGYDAMLRAEDTAEADARRENLGELVGAIAEYELAEEVPTLTGFLERVALDSGSEADAGTERLTLMTVHAAKGLEFDVVMVTGMEEEIFPHRVSQRFDPEDLDEERRLAYVAFTRARRRLVLSHADMRRLYGQVKDGGPSRFLREIEALVQQVDTRPAHLRGGSGSGYGGSYGGQYGGRGGYGGASGYGGYGGRPTGDASRGRAFEREDDDAIDPVPAEVAPPAQRPLRSTESYVDVSDGDVGGHFLRAGARVTHAKFGPGVVRSVQGGMPPKCVVRFASVGEKTVVATFLAPDR